MIKHEFMKGLDAMISRTRDMMSSLRRNNLSVNDPDFPPIHAYLECGMTFKKKMMQLCDKAVVYDIPNLESAQGETAYSKNMDAYLDKGQTKLPHDIMLIRTYATYAHVVSMDEITTPDISPVYILAMSRDKLQELDGEYDLPEEIQYVYMCFLKGEDIHYSNLCWNSVYVEQVNKQVLTLAILRPHYLFKYNDLILNRLCNITQMVFEENQSIESHAFYILETFNVLRACRNIDIVEVTPKELTKKQRKQKREEPKPYHVIKVVLPNKKTTSDHPVTTRGATHLHIDLRVGHFKTFTEDKPLFGKHTGTYWWQPIAKNVNTAHYEVKLK